MLTIPPLISRSGCCSASPPLRPFTIRPLPRSVVSSAPPRGGRSRSIHPLPIARFAVALLLAAFALMALFGLTAAVAASFAVMFGMANGLLTIARGAVPLALFGAAGYSHLVGRIGGPYLVMQAIAPLALAFVAERSCDAAVLAVAAAFATIAFIAFAAVRRPKDIAR